MRACVSNGKYLDMDITSTSSLLLSGIPKAFSHLQAQTTSCTNGLLTCQTSKGLEVVVAPRQEALPSGGRSGEKNNELLHDSVMC